MGREFSSSRTGSITMVVRDDNGNIITEVPVENISMEISD